MVLEKDAITGQEFGICLKYLRKVSIIYEQYASIKWKEMVPEKAETQGSQDAKQ